MSPKRNVPAPSQRSAAPQRPWKCRFSGPTQASQVRNAEVGPTCLGSPSPPRELDATPFGEPLSGHVLSPFIFCRFRSCLEMIISSVFLAISSLCSESSVFSSSTSPVLLFLVCIAPHDRALRCSQGHAGNAVFFLLSEKPSQFLISSGPDCAIYSASHRLPRL